MYNVAARQPCGTVSWLCRRATRRCRTAVSSRDDTTLIEGDRVVGVSYALHRVLSFLVLHILIVSGINSTLPFPLINKSLQCESSAQRYEKLHVVVDYVYVLNQKLFISVYKRLF